jgi:hypothetical protein
MKKKYGLKQSLERSQNFVLKEYYQNRAFNFCITANSAIAEPPLNKVLQ